MAAVDPNVSVRFDRVDRKNRLASFGDFPRDPSLFPLSFGHNNARRAGTISDPAVRRKNELISSERLEVFSNVASQAYRSPLGRGTIHEGGFPRLGAAWPRIYTSLAR